MTKILHLLKPYKFTRIIPTPEGIEIRYENQSRKFTHCPTVEEILEAIEELIPEPPRSIRIKNEPKDFQIFERAEYTSHNTVYRQAKTGDEKRLSQLLFHLNHTRSNSDSRRYRPFSAVTSSTSR